MSFEDWLVEISIQATRSEDLILVSAKNLPTLRSIEYQRTSLAREE